MSDQPILSIITVCYDDPGGVAATARSIGSAFGSSGVTVDWIVIDGSARPDVREVVAQAGDEYSTLMARYIGEGDAGVYDAMNKGTFLARGEYVQYLNSGDCYLPGVDIAPLLEALADSPIWVTSGATHGLGTGSPARTIANVPHRWARHALGMQPHCHQACWFARNVVIALGGYDESVGFVADFQLIMQMGVISRPRLVPSNLIFYEGGGVSANRGGEIPALLSAVRRRALLYDDPVALSIESAFSKVQSCWRRFSCPVNRLRKRLHGGVTVGDRHG